MESWKVVKLKRWNVIYAGQELYNIPTLQLFNARLKPSAYNYLKNSFVGSVGKSEAKTAVKFPVGTRV